MVIGSLTVTLHVPDSQSLKDKRSVVRSLTAKLRRTFNVAVAEIEDQNLWQTSVLGVVCVSGESRHADEMSQKILHWIEAEQGDAVITTVAFELIHI